MPDVTGKTLSEACSELKKIGLNMIFDCEGEYVVAQVPNKDTLLYSGEIVYLVVN